MTSHLSKSGRVVSNASPLIYPAKAGQLSLLRDLFHDIKIPEEVCIEACGSQDSPDATVISSAVNEGWIHVANSVVGDVNLLARSSGIDIGEAAAILLAKETEALLLIDDKMGRMAAEILGVRCMGTVGVLLKAISDSGIVLTKFTEILDRMIDSGFRLDSKVYRLVLKAARNLSEGE